MTATARRRAVFLDKDGTLVVDVPYNVDPSRLRLVPDAALALRSLADAGYLLVVVSNQPGIARGVFEASAFAPIERALRELLERGGARLDGCYVCPHAPDGSVARYAVACTCRKPAPGLLFGAADELDVDLTRSWMVGDILDDVEAGRAAGCRTVLIDAGNETEWTWAPSRIPDAIVPDLVGAATRIVGAEAPGRALGAREVAP
jgi:histidinol-phosphate phosphatase family protein